MTTKDNNKKAKDNNALNAEKNEHYMKNKQAGKHSYSKKTDHLKLENSGLMWFAVLCWICC